MNKYQDTALMKTLPGMQLVVCKINAKIQKKKKKT